MKLSSAVGLILFITFFFFAYGTLISDFEANYIDTNISQTSPVNDSSISGFDDTEFLNESIQPIKESFDDLATDEGFFDAIADLAAVIPKAIIIVPTTMFVMFARGALRIQQILSILDIPVEIIIMAGVGLVLWLIFKLIEFWRRNPV